MGTLPLAPAPDDTDESGPGDGSNDAPPAGAPAPPEAAETPAEAPVPPVPPLDVPPVNLAQCVSYESGFLPQVHDPVCSSCHTGNNGLPAFEPFAQAQRRCAQIGREVASGSMPPGGGLSAARRETVANWVGLGCPETDAQALALCSQAPTNGGGGATPAAPAGDDDDDGDDDRDDDDDDDDDDRGGDDDDDRGDDD